MDIKILEERRVMRTGPCKVTDIPCSECGSPLIKDELVLGFRLMCDNHECSLFREGQGIELKEIRPKLSRTWRPDYPDELKRVKRNYDFLCKLGIRSKLAARHKSNKRTERIRKMAKRGLTAESINSVLVLRNNDN